MSKIFKVAIIGLDTSHFVALPQLMQVSSQCAACHRRFRKKSGILKNYLDFDFRPEAALPSLPF